MYIHGLLQFFLQFTYSHVVSGNEESVIEDARKHIAATR